MINKQSLIDRFIRYVKIDTQSDDTVSDRFPSTEKQLVLSNLLVKELKELGLTDVTIDEFGYVMATVPSNIDKKVPTIGFLAHVDTAPDMPGKNVNPRFVENYDGKDIQLSPEVAITVKDFPELKHYVGQTLIVTDGTTLLGADDKAGIAEIMTAVEYMVSNPSFKHGPIRIGFTADEEVGRGVDHFDVKRFNADFGYTLDGGAIGELEYENFNAAGAKLCIQGTSIHPGSAKGKMINALLLAMEFQGMLPIHDNPMYTEKYEGFYMLEALEGGVDSAKASYIIRDHDKVKFQQKKDNFLKIVNYLNDKYGEETFKASIKDSYYNMKEKVEPHFHLIENAKKAMEDTGVKPIVSPIRGGTDGARLSYMGLPCPNICTGGHNFHGRYEYISIQSMEKVVEILLNIIRIYTE